MFRKIANAENRNIMGNRCQQSRAFRGEGYVIADDAMKLGSFAASDLPVLGLGDSADAGPAVLVDAAEVLHALQIDGDVLALLLGGLLADGVG